MPTCDSPLPTMFTRASQVNKVCRNRNVLLRCSFCAWPGCRAPTVRGRQALLAVLVACGMAAAPAAAQSQPVFCRVTKESGLPNFTNVFGDDASMTTVTNTSYLFEDQYIKFAVPSFLTTGQFHVIAKDISYDDGTPYFEDWQKSFCAYTTNPFAQKQPKQATDGFMYLSLDDIDGLRPCYLVPPTRYIALTIAVTSVRAGLVVTSTP